MPTPRPADRSGILTEQRSPRSMELHQRSVAECVALMTSEDRAAQAAVERAAPAITEFIEAVEPRFRRGGRLIYLGAGTSGRLGVLDASECPPTFCVPPERVVGIIAGGDAALRRSSEGKEDDPRGSEETLRALRLTTDDTLLGIAAGGTTPYVLGAFELLPRLVAPGTPGAPPPLAGLLVCTPMPKPDRVDHLIVLETGPEVLTGSTRLKAGTATKMTLNIISTTLMIRTGKVYQNLMVDVRATNAKLRDRAARIVAELTGASRDQAFDLLDRAGGGAKTAVVMHVRGVTRVEAEAMLERAEGRLDRVLHG